MKSNKRVFVLTPASLKMNFFSEMKKCGDDLYKKNQFWEFVSIEGKPDYIGILSKSLSLSIDYIKKHKGAWMVNIKKQPNYAELSTEDQKIVDEQLNEKYRSRLTLLYDVKNKIKDEIFEFLCAYSHIDNVFTKEIKTAEMRKNNMCFGLFGLRKKNVYHKGINPIIDKYFQFIFVDE
jgi:hypothetical protein